jgi:hypothetical protein
MVASSSVLGLFKSAVGWHSAHCYGPELPHTGTHGSCVLSLSPSAQHTWLLSKGAMEDVADTELLFLAQQPPVGQGLLIIEASRSHSDTPHSVGLLWTSDQPEADTSTWQHTTLTGDIHASGGIRTRSPSKRMPQTARPLGSAETELLYGDILSCFHTKLRIMTSRVLLIPHRGFVIFCSTFMVRSGDFVHESVHCNWTLLCRLTAGTGTYELERKVSQ